MPRWQGVVTQVVDGDSLHIRPDHGGKPVSVRLEGIDAPEICQAGGARARAVLRQRVLKQRVTVSGYARDMHARLVARVNLRDEDVGRYMVLQGQAWSYRWRRDPGPYAAEQQQAAAARRGIFAGGVAPAMNPRQFRRQHGPCRE